MAENWEIYTDWNPWHGCTKISAGCKFCYVYRQDAMYGSEISSSECRKTANFNLPIKRRRDKSWKIPGGRVVFTCFTSDFLLKDADQWRPECWQMIRQRSDLWFYFFTKRIDRFMECVPDDWGNGYNNVLVGCTVENQAMADYRLPIFLKLPRFCTLGNNAWSVAYRFGFIRLVRILSKTAKPTAFPAATNSAKPTKPTSTTKSANIWSPKR